MDRGVSSVSYRRLRIPTPPLRKLATATDQQQMSCAFHETGVPRVDLLELRELTPELLVHQNGRWILPMVRHEAIVKDIEATQVFAIEMLCKAIL